MAQDYASSINGQFIRVTRLNADGTLATSVSASYGMKSFISVSFTPEYEEGDEITQKNAAGEVCATFQSPDTLKRVTLEVAICDPDPEFTWVAAGGTLLTTAGKNVGWKSPAQGIDALPYGVALDVWSLAINNGKAATTGGRYWHWVFPYAMLRPSGDRVIENGLLANTFEGWGVGNSGYGDGADNQWLWGAPDSPYQYARTDSIPTLTNGFLAVTP